MVPLSDGTRSFSIQPFSEQSLTVKARLLLLLVSRAFLERHMERAGKK
jgi:hypothetical protein